MSDDIKNTAVAQGRAEAPDSEFVPAPENKGGRPRSKNPKNAANIRVRLDAEQLEIFNQNLADSGRKNPTDFVRFATLEIDFAQAKAVKEAVRSEVEPLKKEVMRLGVLANQIARGINTATKHGTQVPADLVELSASLNQDMKSLMKSIREIESGAPYDR